MTEPLLEVRDLKKHFPITAGFLRKTVGLIKAVDGVSFDIGKGQTLGLVGESGCGKTTTGRLILRVLERTSGQMIFRRNDKRIDLATLRGEELRRFRRHMQLIFQDPFASLNPRLTIRDLVAEPIRALDARARDETEHRVTELIESVGLKREFLNRYPHAFSGGQRQRIGIARALALNPELIICDEPVSALDVSVQAQIVNLLKDLQEQLGLTYLFIAHDLSVVENISTRVAVMYTGRIVEMADTNDLFHHPRHPYTEALMNALPKPDPALKTDRIILPGEVADPSNLPPGCAFHPRCRYCQDPCKQTVPDLRDLGNGHLTACLRAEQINLQGVKE
ncbi:MAG: ATP-binding cassette domain-containing protein [Phycisphaerae bacterium]|nr:ATP-binding cassette domain-containing protein [Phycisphaerae bacterium]